MATPRTAVVAIMRARHALGRVPRFECLGAPLVALLASTSASAEEPKPSPPAVWGFSGTFGTGSAGGDSGNRFTKPVTWEYTFFRQKGPWRLGAGLTFASFKMQEPYQDELEWGYQEIFLFGTQMFNRQGAVRPYIQLRGGIARPRPRSELFKVDPLPPDWEKGQATQEKSDGFSFGVVPGVELKLSRAAFLDASVSYKYFSVSEYDLSPVGLPPASSGTAWEGRLGITWFPNGEQQGKGDEGGPRDAWGVKRSYGWAAGEVLAINNIAGVTAQYVRNVDSATGREKIESIRQRNPQLRVYVAMNH
jgi:hypothetical protein